MRRAGRGRRRLACAAGVFLFLLLGGAAEVAAQVPAPRDTARAPRDTFAVPIPRADTLRAESPRADTLPSDSTVRPKVTVEWAEDDSVMRALRGRPGWVATRYQGERVVFQARDRQLTLVGHRAAVERGEVLVVGDTIVFNDSTQFVVVATTPGDTVYLRDPAQGQDDIIAQRLTYDLADRRGTVSGISTSVVSGERWFVAGSQAGFAADSAPEGRSRIYVHQGSITSCDLTYPHYHFEASNIKVIKNSIMVARPAVLYIGDVPVLWLPFIFQDMREGRRSGFLTPRFGVAELFRSNPSYQRSVENIGYYFNLGNYFDAEVSVDWRSGARGTTEDPGYWRYNAGWRYKWLDRFLNGEVAANYDALYDGTRNLAVHWNHQQQFSSRTSLAANVNYAQNTRVQRQISYVPATALATIASQVNFQQRFRNFSYSLGGSGRQYPGRDQKDYTVPTFNLTTQPLELASWLTWTPNLSLTNTLGLDLDQTGQFAFRPTTLGPDGVVLDSVRLSLDRRSTQIGIETPFKIFNFNWRNSIRIRDSEENFPVTGVVYDPTAPGGQVTRTFARKYLTDVDWQTDVSLPQIFQGTWNIVPSIGIQNVESQFGYIVRSERTGDAFVRQSKRITGGVAISPTLFRLYPGFGPFSRLRHSISPTLSWNVAPAARVNDEFLAAVGINPATYLGALAQNSISLGLTTNIEAKLRGTADSGALGENAEKVRLVSLNFTPLSYDFIRADTAASGITTTNFGFTARSDLLPGFDLQMNWSLFQGDPASDTAVFKPFRTNVRASFNLGRDSDIIGTVARLFGREPAPRRAGPDTVAVEDTTSSVISSRPVSGADTRLPVPQIPTGQGWRANF
ncbi:MAG TPA: putative LPS assembly protein LptD, partial [Gemmatimonadaceae bacterium]|nr:putative LPS assembly protein LptD [Gemmatimonadaceae bacterium]